MPGRSLDIWMNGELVGHWTIHRNQDEFSYAPSWLAFPARRPISLSMPLQPADQAYKGPPVRNFFDNLLPDTQVLRQRLHQRFGTDSTGAFDLLTEIGRDCVGAIALLRPQTEPFHHKKIEARSLDEDEVEEKLLLARGDTALGQRVDDFRISIAGAQEKTALLWHRGRWCQPIGSTPTTHIFKLPIGQAAMGIDLSTSVENEWLCHKLLQALEIPVADCRMSCFGAQKTLVVERLDRQWSTDGKWIIRLPQEDLCQAMGLPSGRKYESDGGPGITGIMELLRGSRLAAQDRVDFYRTQIAFWMLCAIDGHAKNFSLLIEPQGRFRLAPRYDVLSAYPVLGHAVGKLSTKVVKMAMAAWGKNRHYRWNDIFRRHWERVGLDCGISTPSDVISQLVRKTPDAIRSVQSDLPENFPVFVASPILEGLRKAADRLRN